MNLWWQVARRSFERDATYRVATLTAIVESTVVTVLRAYVWLAVLGDRDSLRGLDAAEVVTFAFLAQAVHIGFMITWESDIALRIRSGDVVIDLYRPVDFQGWWFAHDAGRSAFLLVARGVPPFIVGGLLFELSLPTEVVGWLPFVPVIMLAFVVVFAWRFIVALSAFWLLNPRGVLQLSGAVYTFCSGSLVPLSFMPAWLETALRWLPFASMVQLPAEVLVGDRSVWSVLPVQAAWAAALLAVGRVVLRRAQRRLVVQGG